MASVIQTMTAKVRIASMRWPATGRPAGVGSNSTATSAATASKRPQLPAIQLGFRTVEGRTPPAGTGSATDMGSSLMLKSRRIIARIDMGNFEQDQGSLDPDGGGRRLRRDAIPGPLFPADLDQSTPSRA